jgi:hypothetical protein
MQFQVTEQETQNVISEGVKTVSNSMQELLSAYREVKYPTVLTVFHALFQLLTQVWVSKFLGTATLN